MKDAAALSPRSESDVLGLSRPQARRRRLCMVVHGPYPIDEPRVACEVTAAASAGYEVHVVAMMREREPRVEVVEGATVFRLPVRHVRGSGVAAAIGEYIGFTLLASLIVARHTLRRGYDV